MRFVLAAGGYHVVYRAVRYFTTSYFEEDGKGWHMKPNDFGGLAFACCANAYLRAPDA